MGVGHLPSQQDPGGLKIGEKCLRRNLSSPNEDTFLRRHFSLSTLECIQETKSNTNINIIITPFEKRTKTAKQEKCKQKNTSLLMTIILFFFPRLNDLDVSSTTSQLHHNRNYSNLSDIMKVAALLLQYLHHLQ